jgi:ABC-type transport system substrate-binding protein
MHKRLFGLLASGAIVVAACGGPQATPAPSASAPSSTGSAPPASSAPPAAEQTLTMVMDGDVSGGLSNAADNVPTAEAVQFLYDGIYTYDASLTPQPNLSESLADISDDGKVWTIKLKSGLKFHDGTDLTSADVVQTYQIAASENCRYNPSICLTGFTTAIEAVDELTVRFTLTDPLATFATVFLPAVLIESEDAVDASYERYLEGTQQLTAAEVKTVLDAVAAEEKTPTGPAGEDGKPTVNWDPHLAAMKALIEKAGQTPPDEAGFQLEDGSLDKATYGSELKNRVNAINETFVGSEIDALAAAYPYLDFQLNPVGSGPFKFVSFKSGESLEFEANADYHRGAPQIAKMFIPIIKEDLAGGQALVAGQVDWKYSLEGATFNQIKDDPNLKFVEYPDFGFFGLYFNMHPDANALFADKNLRQAVAHCFDKKETVNAATEGQGVPVYSDIPPASWAYPASGLNEYPYDQAKSKSLIEASGWTLGSDGVYEKDGRKLSTVVAVRAGRPNRSAFMQLLSDQVKDCGIDITYKEVDFDAILTMLDNYPHINAAAPETNRPYDAYFGGFSTSLDPDPYSLYHSSQCSTAENPQTFNYECYQNPQVDKLIEDGLKTFDQAERAAIYQEYAKLQAEDLPVLYGWSDIAREGLRATVDSTGGLQMDSPTFFWEIEKLTNIE